MFKAKFEKISLNARGRDIAVGDIHGCFTALQRGLDHIGFDPLADCLFAVGDLVDGNFESRDVTTWLDFPWFYAICGNHELMTWRSALGDPYPGVDHLAFGGGWLYTLSIDEQRRIANRLTSLSLVMEVETPKGAVGLVHADCPCDDWADMQSADWHQFSDTHQMVETCLWSIDRHKLKYKGLVRNVRAVVHGHMTVPEIETLGNVFYIDTGGWKPEGRFTFLNLHTLEPVFGIGGRIVNIPRRYRGKMRDAIDTKDIVRLLPNSANGRHEH
jgi:serine/threonine protein phosphatase 1